MKRLVAIIGLLSLLALGCKHQYFTFTPAAEEGNTVAVSQPANNQAQPEPEREPEPEPEPLTPKQVIMILGIDGMD